MENCRDIGDGSGIHPILPRRTRVQTWIAGPNLPNGSAHCKPPPFHCLFKMRSKLLWPDSESGTELAIVSSLAARPFEKNAGPVLHLVTGEQFVIGFSYGFRAGVMRCLGRMVRYNLLAFFFVTSWLIRMDSNSDRFHYKDS
jgi:hypothetical protein